MLGMPAFQAAKFSLAVWLDLSNAPLNLTIATQYLQSCLLLADHQLYVDFFGGGNFRLRSLSIFDALEPGVERYFALSRAGIGHLHFAE